jgi:acyl dehydratase
VRVLGPITLTDVVRYQGASGDLNPVHHDSAAVRETGWPAVLVPGPYPAAVLCDLAAEQHGADRLRRADLRFAASCWVGDTLLCSIAPPTVTDGLLRVEPGCGRESDGRRVTSAVVDFVTDLPR